MGRGGYWLVGRLPAVYRGATVAGGALVEDSPDFFLPSKGARIDLSSSYTHQILVSKAPYDPTTTTRPTVGPQILRRLTALAVSAIAYNVDWQQIITETPRSR